MHNQQMDITTFCEVHGCDQFNSFALGKWGAAKGQMTYAEWHELASAEFTIGENRFQTPIAEPTVVEEAKVVEEVIADEEVAAAPAKKKRN